jgi:hypothetical protein
MSKSSKGFLARFFGTAQEVVPEEVQVKQRLTSQIHNALAVALKNTVGSYEYFIEDTDIEEKFVIYMMYSTGKYLKRTFTNADNGEVILSDTAIEVTEAPRQWVEVKTAEVTTVEPTTETIIATETTMEEPAMSENKPCTCGAASPETASEVVAAPVVEASPISTSINAEDERLLRELIARQRVEENDRREKAVAVIARSTGVKQENLSNVPTAELEVLAKSLVSVRYGSASTVPTEPVASAWDTPKKEAN